MKVVNLGENPSVLNNFIAEMRDATIQKDSLRFRINLERVGEIFAYEISKVLSFSEKDVITPLGTARVATTDTPLVISTILRAGLHGLPRRLPQVRRRRLVRNPRRLLHHPFPGRQDTRPSRHDARHRLLHRSRHRQAPPGRR